MRTLSDVPVERARLMFSLRVACCAALLTATLARCGRAQDVEPSVPLAQPADTQAIAPHIVSPRGAFLRSVLVPGWGHASIGAYHRAAFYFMAEGTTAWNMVKTRHRLDEARRRLQFRDDVLRAQLADEGITEPDEIQARLDADATLQDLTALEEARGQQQEDWVALGIFMLFLSGADAYVSTHLSDFPVPLSLSAQPVGDQGRMGLSVRLTLSR